MLIALALLAPRVLISQQAPQTTDTRKVPRPHRSGLWGELGSGAGHVRIACSSCTDAFGANGTTGHVRIGGVISDHVLIGFEVFSLLDKAFAVSPEDSAATAETGTAAIIIMWYPGRRGLFFKGGIGAAFGQFSIPTDSAGTIQADTSQGGGIGLTFGLGWDFAISRKFAFTANAATYVTALGDVVLAGRRVDDLIATTYQASVGFTIR